MKKVAGRIGLAILLILVIIVLFKYKTIKRLYTTIHLFDQEVIIDNFRNMDKHYDVARLSPAPVKTKFPKNIHYKLPGNFKLEEITIHTDSFIHNKQLEGLMILQNDTIIYEDYFLDLSPEDTHISWSVAKSIVATLLGIAWDDGLFKLEDEITEYLPQFKDTGYDKVLIKDLLQMSTGVRFNEDYSDFNSDINRFGRVFALGTPLEDFSKSLENEKTPGTYCHYVSINTQVLGMLLKKITGESLTSYYQRELWNPMGMEDNGEWIVDNTGMEVALGGLNMSMRDYAKMGLLYLHKGKYNGKQLVSEEWIEMATTPDAPHLMPGRQSASSHVYGYGFQWWIPAVDEGDFFAAGIYDQYIYVQPSKDLVIVALSANYHFKTRDFGERNQHIAFFKEIARDMK